MPPLDRYCQARTLGGARDLCPRHHFVGRGTMMFSTTKPTILAAALATLAASHAAAADFPVKAGPVKPAAQTPFFIVNDNSLSYYYAFTATNPGAGTTPKHVVAFTHFDVWAYG